MSDLNLAKRGIVTSWIYQAGEKMQRGDSDKSIVADLRMIHGADADSAQRVVAELRAAGNALTPLDDAYINLVRELMTRAVAQPTPDTQATMMSAGMRAANPRQIAQKQHQNFQATRWIVRGAVCIAVAVIGLVVEFFKGTANPTYLGIGILFMLILGGVMIAMGRQDQAQ